MLLILTANILVMYQYSLQNYLGEIKLSVSAEVILNLDVCISSLFM